MNGRYWQARRVGREIRVRRLVDGCVLLEFFVPDAEAAELVTQLDVARHVPADHPDSMAGTPPPPSRL